MAREKRKRVHGSGLRAPIRCLSALAACCLAMVALDGCRPLTQGASAGHPEAPPRPEAPATKTGVFQDVTAQAGIHFEHTNGANLRYPLLQTMGGGCAFLDYDNDGMQDILLLSCGEFPEQTTTPVGNLALYRNSGNGTFVDVSRGSGLDVPLGYAQALAVGDYDNDGYPDVFVAGYGGCHLFHNRGGAARQGGPQFEDVTARAGVGDTETGPRWASCAAWGDYDNDGKLDLYVGHYAVWSPAIDRQCPRPDGSPGLCPPDLYMGDTGRLFHNIGGGRFEDVTRKAGIAGLHSRTLAVTWMDFDDDGHEDLLVINDRDPHRLLRNRGDGTFEDVAASAGVALSADGVAASGMGVAAADYDHSGHESVFITNLNGEGYSLFHNDGRGQFTYATERAGLMAATYSTSAWGTAFVDFDRDGWPDLITANGHVNPFVDADVAGVNYEEPVGLFRNLGGGQFVDASGLEGPMARRRSTRGLAIGDYDNDGRVDVVCINRNGPAELFRNVSGDRNHWINLRLVGTRSNRDGAGARVWVTVGGVRRVAECRLSSSYASSSDKRLFFGLGAATSVDSVEIRWPSGIRARYANVAADHFYAVTEGGGCVADTMARRVSP